MPERESPSTGGSASPFTEVRLLNRLEDGPRLHQAFNVKVGNSRVISPVGQRWDSFFASGPHVSDDFMTERDQGEFEDREPF